MKLPVIETKHLELEYSGTNSSLINEIFRDIFNVSLNYYGIEFKEEDGGISVYHDNSIHGSPTFELIKRITDKDKIELYKSLVKTYNLLRDMEND